MVIDEFNLVNIAVLPDKAHAPPVVDPDAVLAEAIVDESFQIVAGRHGQSFQSGRGIELEEFPERNPLGVGAEPLGGSTLEDILGVTVTKALDHLS